MISVFFFDQSRKFTLETSYDMVNGSRVAAGIADLEIRDVAAEAGVDVVDDALPVGLRHAAEDGAQQQFFVAAE